MKAAISQWAAMSQILQGIRKYKRDTLINLALISNGIEAKGSVTGGLEKAAAEN